MKGIEKGGMHLEETAAICEEVGYNMPVSWLLYQSNGIVHALSDDAPPATYFYKLPYD